MAHHWVSTSSKRELPRFAVIGGHDCKGKISHVGRCYHEGDLLPASVKPDNEYARVSRAGETYYKDEYEILVGPGYYWVPCKHDGVPRYAVSSGNCSRGEPLYIGRGYHNGYLCVGKVHPTHDCLYIPYGGRELRICKYELLLQAPPDHWLPVSLENPPPPDAVLAGNDSDGTANYVARAMHDGAMLPAKFVPDRGEAYAINDGFKIHKKQDIDVLCGSNYAWIQPHENEVPANAVLTGRRHDGEPMIVGRANYSGSVTPGLVSADGCNILIPFGDAAVRVEKYEILIKHHP